MLLKRGNIGAAVARLIDDLIALGFAPATGPGSNFTGSVEIAVKAFQSQNIGPNWLPLVVDGEVGPLTQWAIDVALGRSQPAPPPSSFGTSAVALQNLQGSSSGWNAVQIALAEHKRGAGESGSDNAGPDVMRYHAVTGGLKGYDWCASFVSYCFKEGNPGAMPFEPTFGARDMLQKFKKKHWHYTANLENPPAAGDIIVWWRHSLNDWRGHIGLVSAYDNGIVYTIEGNRGSFPAKVGSFSYTLGQIDKLLGFGRPVP